MKPVAGVPGVDFTIEDVRGVFPEEIEIQPLDHPVDATIKVPGSKSVTNRVLIIAALADGPSTINNPLFSDDSFWLMEALIRLGFKVHADRDEAGVQITGKRGIIPQNSMEVFVGNAGTVARFLPPVLALGEGPYWVDGVPRMRERPVADLVDAMRGLGAGVKYAGEGGRFPLVVEGGGLRGGTVRVRGGKSSQFVSGLLMAAPYAGEPVTLEIEGRKDWPYVGITADVMRDFGVEVGIEDSFRRLTVEPGAYAAKEYAVEPDASAASYFLAAAAVTGGWMRIPGLGAGSPQGDLRFAGVLRKMGCEVELGSDFIELRGPGILRGVDVDMGAFSDTMITLSAIAPFASSPTTIRNVGHTRHQETDRIAAIATELGRLGVRVEEAPDSLRITPGPVSPAAVRTYGDHRMAMAFAVTGLAAPGIRIREPGCVTKTFPDYFQRLDALR